MGLYIDTSSLAKLYFEEEDSNLIQKELTHTETVYSSVITYPEICSAFARRRKEGHFELRDYKKSVALFEEHWQKISKMPVTIEIALAAGHLSQKHSIKGMDSVHLATACLLRDELREDIRFLSSDLKQLQAASKEDLVV